MSLKNFKAVQPLEIDRTLKFRYVAGNVTQPQSLKDRATKASEALQAYQNALAKADSNLAGPLPPADIAALMQTHRATADVESTLDLLSKSEEAGVKAALKDFNDARRVEDAAITLTEKACPADVYDLFRHRAELKMH